MVCSKENVTLSSEHAKCTKVVAYKDEIDFFQMFVSAGNGIPRILEAAADGGLK